MLPSPLDTLRDYVNLPSGTWDTADVAALAARVAADFACLGFAVEAAPGALHGPTLVCRLGTGDQTLLLMGHMDTVFPRAQAAPYRNLGDGVAAGSGISDMKGGLVVMLYALARALPRIDLTKTSLCAVLNPDEEIGSPESHAVILSQARRAFAALSFEPGGADGCLTCARKGVTSVLVTCRGMPGHAGAQYKTCASAIQALCAQITRLYALRDDARDISFNAGLIEGGTAENVVAPAARCKCEFRYFDEALKRPLMDSITAICREEPVKGAVTEVSFGASHPAIDMGDKSRALLDRAMAIAASQGRTLGYERSGGAGDIAIAAQAGIGVLDGLGLPGGGMHTASEYANIALLPKQIDLASRLIQDVCGAR